MTLEIILVALVLKSFISFCKALATTASSIFPLKPV